MADGIRAGVVGLGILGGQHARFLHQHEEVELVAVSDLRQEAGEKTAAATGAKAYTRFEEMLQKQALDYVVIATPDPQHRDPALEAIRAGVPAILLEKPMATTTEDAEAIYNAVEQKGCRLFMDFANRSNDLDIATRYVIRQGLLGRVVYGETRLDDNITVPTAMWGQRSREWAAGSSSAHFLLSHVIDLLRFYFGAEVRQVYAISQQVVLGYSPDLYDAFLTFDSGLKVRVKAEWIKHMDDLVEFYSCFSGSKGTLIYNKKPGFGGEPGWRANISTDAKGALLEHQKALFNRGVNVTALVHRPRPTSGSLEAGGGKDAAALEFRGPATGGTMALGAAFIRAILENTDEPECWAGNGPLPNHLDGLRQTEIVTAIVKSAERGETVDLP